MVATLRTNRLEVLRVPLVADLARRCGAVLIEAPFGFGKSVLLRQIADAFEGSVSSLDHEGTLRTPGSPPTGGASLVLVDEVADLDSVRSVEAMLANGSASLVVLAARSLPFGARRILAAHETCEVRADRLAFSQAEVAALLSLTHPASEAATVASVIGPTTEGWPAAVEAVVRSLGTERDAMRRAAVLVQQSPVLTDLVDACVAELDSNITDAFVQLAHLPMFTSAAVDALAGPGALERAIEAGMPVVQGADAWLRMPSVVMATLRSRSRFGSETARRVAPALIASAGVIPGVRVLLMAGATEDAARLVSDLPGSAVDAIDTHEFLGVLRTLEPHADQFPRLHLAMARVFRNLSWVQDQEAAVDAARRAAEIIGDDDVLAESEAELLFIRSVTGRSDGVAEALVELRDRVASPNPSVRVRLQELEAIALGQSSDPLEVERSQPLLTEVAAQWEYLGEHSTASSTLRLMAATTLGHLGDHRAAQQAARKARSLVIDRPFHRAVTAVLMARASALAGDEAAFGSACIETEALARATGLRWIEGYLEWAHMHMASLRGDTAALDRHWDAASEALGPLRDEPTGDVFRFESAAAFAFVGDIARADAELAAARAGINLVEEQIATIIVHARARRVTEAEQTYAEAKAMGLVPATRRWRIDLEMALMYEQTRVAPAAPYRDRAQVTAARLGLDELFAALDGGVHAAPDGGEKTAVEVGVLGTFAVHHDGDLVAVPTGRVSELLKMLAISHGRVSVETAIDRLWPEVSLETGRRRLKNVVNRMRTALGNDSVDRDADSIVLGSGVVSDLDLFEAAAQRALTACRADDDVAGELVMTALSNYAGPVLPDDTFTDWIDEARLATLARAVALLDALMTNANVVIPGPWLLDVVLRISPGDDTRLIAVARHCAAQGHDGSARAAMEQACRVAEDLGVNIDAEIEDLRYLRAG